jgi:MFS family permease
VIDATKKSGLIPYYLSFLFRYGFSIVQVLSVLYFHSKGFSYFDISIYMSIIALSTLIFEIPTSIFADKYGRKKSVIMGYIGTTIIFALYPFVEITPILLLMGFINGFFATFASGSDTSLIVDNLKKKSYIQKYYVTITILFKVAGIMQGVLGFIFLSIFKPDARVGNFLAIDYLWFIYAFAMLIATLIFVIGVKELNFKPSKEHSFKLSWECIKYIIKQHNLRLIFLWKFFFFIVFYAWFFLYLPYLSSFGIEINKISLAYTLLFVVGLPFIWVGKKIFDKIKKEKPFLIMNYLAYFLFSITVIFFNGKMFAYVYWYIKWNFAALFSPIESSYQETFILSKFRSTTHSIQTIVTSGGGAIGAFIGGLLLNNATPQYAIFYSSFLIIPVIVLVAFLKK